MMDQSGIPSLVKDPGLVRKRRQQIIQGAFQLFVHKGFHKTTTREIARECGLSIGTMYEYIQSKEDVLYLVCDHIHAELEKRLRTVLTGISSGREGLTRAVSEHFRLMGEMKEYVLLIYQETKSLSQEGKGRILEKEQAMTALFEQLLRRGIGDGTLRLEATSIPLMAHNIMVLGQMWSFRNWALGGQYTLEEYTRRQTDLLIQECTKTSTGGEPR